MGLKNYSLINVCKNSQTVDFSWLDNLCNIFHSPLAAIETKKTIISKFEGSNANLRSLKEYRTYRSVLQKHF